MPEFSHHPINVFVVDAGDRAIKRALVTVQSGGKAIASASTSGLLDQPVRFQLPANLESIELVAKVGDHVKKATVLANVGNYTFKFEKVEVADSQDGSNSTTPKFIWVPALSFTSLIIVFLMVAFFATPDLTPGRVDIVNKLFAVLCGFAALFMGGTASFALNFPKSNGGKIAFSATAGIAVFAFVFVYPPYWYKSTHGGCEPIWPVRESAIVLYTSSFDSSASDHGDSTLNQNRASKTLV